MKLREYIANLQKLAEERPETLDMDVIYSKDDEGNGYGQVYYAPGIGEHDSEGEYTPESSVKEEPEEYGYDSFDDFKPNVVCIN